MATSKARRIIEIDVTTSKGLQRGIRQVNTQLRSIEGNAKKTSREVAKMGRSFNVMGLAAKTFIAIRVAKAVTDMSDSMILLAARINIVTEETVGVERAMSDLFDISTLTRQSIESTGTLYARLGFSTKALSLEHEDLLDIVQGVNNTLLLSGASAQESASSIIQLSQAFSKGSLDGDEFRSVSEGNVILFGIMQEVLGKTARELRQFSRDGRLSGDLLAEVLTSQQVKGLQDRVDEIPFTFAQAFTLIGNELSKLAREFEDEFSAITDAIVEGIRGFTVLKQFFDALDSGLLPQASIFDVFDITDVEDQLKALDTISGTLGAKVVGRIADINEEIELLNTQLISQKNILNTLKKPVDIPSFVPDFIADFAKGNQADAIESFTKRINKTTASVTKLREELATLLKPRQDDELDKFKKLGEEGLVDPKVAKEIDALTLSMRNASEVYIDYITNLQKLFVAGKGDLSLETANRAGKAAIDKYDESLKKANKSTKEAQTNMEALGVAIGNTLAKGVGEVSDALFDFAIGLETSFKQTIANILEDIGRLILKITLLNTLKAGLTGTSAGDFLFPSANGNVFDQSGLVPFAAGGIINAPTIFPFSGGTGVAGESGPEAILPLERGSDGKLGVSGAGGPKEVTVNIENNGSDSTVTSAAATTDISGTVVSIVLDDIRRGGPIRDSVKNMREY